MPTTRVGDRAVHVLQAVAARHAQHRHRPGPQPGQRLGRTDRRAARSTQLACRPGVPDAPIWPPRSRRAARPATGSSAMHSSGSPPCRCACARRRGSVPPDGKFRPAHRGAGFRRDLWLVRFTSSARRSASPERRSRGGSPGVHGFSRPAARHGRRRARRTLGAIFHHRPEPRFLSGSARSSHDDDSSHRPARSGRTRGRAASRARRAARVRAALRRRPARGDVVSPRLRRLAAARPVHQHHARRRRSSSSTCSG